MGKENVVYSLIGIGLGLVLGFLVGNWTTPSGGPADSAARAGTEPTSVNQPPTQELPPGHPPIEPGKTTPAGPLPGGRSGPTELVVLPSLDPLPASNRAERAEKKYKNIQILKGLPADRIESIMFAFKDSLGVECTYCHIKDQFDKDDKPPKQMARKMIQLTRDTNAKLGSARVSCFTCHRGQPKPPA
jgi:hypothetical protein